VSILAAEIYQTELSEAEIFYALLAELGNADIFTCPVSLDPPMFWDIPYVVNEMIALLTPTQLMPTIEGGSDGEV
jgi:hypothetical protein